jgi:PadR family transcriptional regulator, regulatory protein AphA
MARENRSKYALLGLLSWGPMSGYDIKKVAEQSISNFWNESYGQIYPILKRLAAEGLAATSVAKRAGKPERYVYALTEKGRKALQRWLRKPAAQEAGRIEILLKLFFGRQVSVPDNIRQLERFQARQRQQLQKYDAIEERLRQEHVHHPDFAYWLMTIGYGRHTCQARLRWCEEVLTTLRAMTGHAQTEQSQRTREPNTQRANRTRQKP